MWFLLACCLPHAIYHAHCLHRTQGSIWRILGYVILFTLAIITEPYAAAFIIYSRGHLVPQVNPLTHRIYDLLHAALPYIPDMFTYFANPMVGLSMVLILYVMCIDGTYRERGLYTLGIVVLFRNFTIIATQLPLSQFDIDSGTCIEYSHLSYAAALSHTWTGYACGDYFFSGHTTFFTTALIAAKERWRLRGVWLGGAIYFVCVLSLLISRVHYSIDVLQAFIVTMTIYYGLSPYIVAYVSEPIFPV